MDATKPQIGPSGRAERPPSGVSVSKGNRQVLPSSTNRRVYATDKAISFNENEMTREDMVNTEQGKQNDGNLTPKHQLKNLVFEQLNKTRVEVRVRCVFMRVGEIDTLNERYYAEILFEASWEEPKLKGLQKKEFNPSVYWTPKLELMNGLNGLRDDISYSIYYDRNGTAIVTEQHSLKGTLWERLELQYFPIDCQDLSLSITTSHSAKEILFVRDLRKPSGVNRQVFTDEQEWFLFEYVDIETTERIEEYFENGDNHPVVVCSCHVARKYGYFMWNAYFLIFLITSASFATFPIPLSIISGRVQISCTLLLTSITFRWLSNKILPTISYLTAVDVYAIGSIFSLCLLNIYHGVIGYVNYYISTNQTGSGTTTISIASIIIIDRWALVVYTVLFFTYQLGTGIWMYRVPWKRRRMMFRKDNENRTMLAAKYGQNRTRFVDILQVATIKNKSTAGVTTISDVE